MGTVTSGAALPIQVTWPPGRTTAWACCTVGVVPTLAEAEWHLVDGVERDGQRLDQRGLLPRQGRQLAVQLARRSTDGLGIGPVLVHADHRPVQADVGAACSAQLARAAGEDRIDDNRVSHLPAGHIRADGADRAGALVAHGDAGETPPGGAGVAVDLRAADANRPHGDDHLAGAGCRRLDLAQWHLPGPS
jgi:hypothetical protein